MKTMNQSTKGTVDIDGGKVTFEVAGEGEPLVFVNAVFDGRMWDDQWSFFQDSHRVIRYDQRGFGKSDGMERPVSRRHELYQVLEATGTRQAVLVGCSLGGETVLDAALERPELAAGLIVVSAVPGGFEMKGEPPKDLMDMLAALEQDDLERAAELQLRIWIDGPSRRPEQVDPAVRRLASDMSRAALAKGNWGLALAPGPTPLDPPAANRLEKIQAPALIIAGELDNAEILRAADVMANRIPNTQKVIIQGAAHLPSMEQPAEFNRAVEEFLNGV